MHVRVSATIGTGQHDVCDQGKEHLRIGLSGAVASGICTASIEYLPGVRSTRCADEGQLWGVGTVQTGKYWQREELTQRLRGSRVQCGFGFEYHNDAFLGPYDSLSLEPRPI